VLAGLEGGTKECAGAGRAGCQWQDSKSGQGGTWSDVGFGDFLFVNRATDRRGSGAGGSAEKRCGAYAHVWGVGSRMKTCVPDERRSR
jgi:hypothetical protein